MKGGHVFVTSDDLAHVLAIRRRAGHEIIPRETKGGPDLVPDGKPRAAANPRVDADRKGLRQNSFADP